MKWRWAAGPLAVPCLIALALAGWVYAASESHLRSFGWPAAFTQPNPTDTENEVSDLYVFLRDMSARVIADGSGRATPAAAGASH